MALLPLDRKFPVYGGALLVYRILYLFLKLCDRVAIESDDKVGSNLSGFLLLFPESS